MRLPALMSFCRFVYHAGNGKKRMLTIILQPNDWLKQPETRYINLYMSTISLMSVNFNLILLSVLRYWPFILLLAI